MSVKIDSSTSQNQSTYPYLSLLSNSIMKLSLLNIPGRARKFGCCFQNVTNPLKIYNFGKYLALSYLKLQEFYSLLLKLFPKKIF